MQHRISVKAVFALAAVTAPALLVALVPASGQASTLRPFLVPQSPNYAGWLAGAPAPNMHGDPSAGSTFTVPTVTGCTTTNDFVVVGIGLPSASSIIATGVAVGCQNGAPFYAGETDINGTITPVSVAITPGDKIVLRLSVTGTATSGSFADVTKGFKEPIKGKGGKSTGSCIGIDGSENGASDPPVPNFGKVVFSGGSINGTTITKSGAVRVNMATTAGLVQISTGLVNAAGTGFTSVFKNTGS
jgi:hypothetical protein